MRLLVLAPQPFYQERGTPIAVRLALEVIVARIHERQDVEHRIDLLTYHEGSDIQTPGVTKHRIRPPRFLSGWLTKIGPGISLKKLVCDVLFLFAALRLVRSHREKYHLVHAVEEGVFVALIIKKLWGIPYIYDMDSSMAMQVTEKWWWLKPLGWILRWFEGLAVKNSMAVAPVCDALGTIAQKHGATAMVVIRDISLLQNNADGSPVSLRSEIGQNGGEILLLYVGNLEPYQGIDLLLRSFQLALKKKLNARVVIIGGNKEDIAKYEKLAQSLQINGQVTFLGPRPIDKLGEYITDTDILVSPRVKGNNTPMKIYSYLHAGRALLATDLTTHTQVLNDQVAKLAPPTPEEFSAAMVELIKDRGLRERLAQNARELAEKSYTFESFRKALNELYDHVDGFLMLDRGSRRGDSETSLNV